MEDDHGGAGVFEFPLQEHFLLEKPEWKYDVVPEILDGKNIADFVDPEIEEKLRQLEEEEDALLAEEGIRMEEDDGTTIPENLQVAMNDVKMKIGEYRVQSRLNRNLRSKARSVSVQGLKEKLESRGKDASKIVAKVKNATLKKRLTLKEIIRREEAEEADEMLEEKDRKASRSRSRMVSKSQVRDSSRQRTPSVYDEIGEKLKRVVDKRVRRKGLAGEADRAIPSLKPKHLNSGKATHKRDYR